MPLIDHRDIARQHRTKLLQSVACAVGAGKTVAVRAATAALDTSRHVIIYLPNPSVGMRGMVHHIVTALGHTPKFYTEVAAVEIGESPGWPGDSLVSVCGCSG